MAFMRKLLFPHPSSKMDEKTHSKIIHVPAFTTTASYQILNSYFETGSALHLPKPAINQESARQSLSRLPLDANFDDLDNEDEPEVRIVNPCQTIKLKDIQSVAIGKIQISEPVKDIGAIADNTQIIIEKDKTFLIRSHVSLGYEKQARPSTVYLTIPETIPSKTTNRKSQNNDNSRVRGVDSLSFVDSQILTQSLKHYMPCLYYPFKGSHHYLIYYHSNAEDVSQMRYLCKLLAYKTRCNILAVEYPSYSIYKGRKPDAGSVCKDAEDLVSFLTETCQISYKNIILMGRSIGSGPVVHLCSIHTFAMTVLISPFLSIKEVVKDKVGFFARFVDPHFNNGEKIKDNRTPLLIIHGKDDNIIRIRHSEKLFEMAKSKSKLVLFEKMPHNKFNFVSCVVDPTLTQMEALGIYPSTNKNLEYANKESGGDEIPRNERLASLFKNIIF